MTVPGRDRPPDLDQPRHRLAWLQRDEGWAPGEGAGRLLLAILVALGAVGLKLIVVRGFGGELGYLSYVGAVVLGAWIAGLRGGLITTGMCAIAEIVLFAEALPASASIASSELFRVGLFLFDGVLVSVITSGLRRAIYRERLASADREAHFEAELVAHQSAERDRLALQRLQAVTASLAGAATPTEVADAILDRGLTALAADAGGVSRSSVDGTELTVIAARGYSPEQSQPGTIFRLDGPSHLADAVRSAQPVFIGNPVDWSERYPESPPHPLPESPTGGAIAILPLVSAGRVLGIVVFRFAEERDFGDGTADLAVRLAEQGAQALDRAIAYDNERTARQGVDRFKAIVDGTADAVYMFDPRSLRLTYVNRGGADLVGRDHEDILGSSVLDLQPEAAAPVFLDRLAGLHSSTTGSTTFTGDLLRGDGNEIPVEAFLQEIRLADGGRTAILTARDVSERIDVQARLTRIAGDERRQAAELRAVIQAMGEGILVVDPSGRISLANDAAAEILGELPTNLTDLAARLGDVGIESLGRPTPEGPDREDDGPLTIALPDRRWIELSSYPADLGGRLLEGAAPSAIVVVRDVTRVRDAEAAREAFLGVLSHELRTPVTTIFGYAKVLQRPSRREDRDEMLADIEVEADRLYRIVEDLLALSRVEGGITIEGEPLLLQHLAGPVVESEAQRWTRTEFETDLPAGLPAVFGERTYVEQVLRNMVSNAGKYSPPGTIVTVTASPTPTEVQVRVLDRGAGISPDEADRLFDLYYRSPVTARTVAGAGIGLYVGRGLINAMGGRIWARPREGGGSEFGFSLPRCDDDAMTATEDVADPDVVAVSASPKATS